MTGRTVSNAVPNSVCERLDRLARCRDVRRDEHEHEPGERKRRRRDLAGGQQPDGVADPGPDRREDDRPEREADQEDRRGSW